VGQSWDSRLSHQAVSSGRERTRAERVRRIRKRTKFLQIRHLLWDGAAPESNRPSRGLHDRTGFEDQLGHRAHAAPRARVSLTRGLKKGAREEISSPALQRAHVAPPPGYPGTELKKGARGGDMVSPRATQTSRRRAVRRPGGHLGLGARAAAPRDQAKAGSMPSLVSCSATFSAKAPSGIRSQETTRYFLPYWEMAAPTSGSLSDCQNSTRTGDS